MRTLTEQRTIYDLDTVVHDIAYKLRKALAFYYSEESDGETIEALGEAVRLARELVAADEALRPFNQDYEGAARG
jgi:hypothetical protein